MLEHIQNTITLQSQDDYSFNCIGWALEQLEWIWPNYRVWPYLQNQGPDSLNTWLVALRAEGYSPTDMDDYLVDQEFDRVALWKNFDQITHMSRTVHGIWTSKCGGCEIFAHGFRTPVYQYGQPFVLFKRPKQTSRLAELEDRLFTSEIRHLLHQLHHQG